MELKFFISIPPDSGVSSLHIVKRNILARDLLIDVRTMMTFRDIRQQYQLILRVVLLHS